MRGLSPAVASGGHSSSRCAGLFTIAASLVAEHRLQTRRLSNRGSRAQLLRGMWDPPRAGLEPVSPALAGGFSTTAPPWKPSVPFYTHSPHALFLSHLPAFSFQCQFSCFVVCSADLELAQRRKQACKSG